MVHHKTWRKPTSIIIIINQQVKHNKPAILPASLDWGMQERYHIWQDAWGVGDLSV
jgi:hypothetical protein